MTLLETFRNDPFFSDVDLPRSLALEHLSLYDDHDRQVSHRRSNDDQTLDLFGRPFDFMQNMVNNMGRMMREMETTMNTHEFNSDNGQGIAFSSSTIMSMDNRNGGEPRIFQATSEKLRGPEGLERTRKGLRDTARNIEKMEVAHRLGERGHKIIKERDPTTGRLLENREFHHIQDEKEFEQEWFNRADKYGLKNTHGNSFDAHTNNVLMAPPSYEHRRALSQEPRQMAIEQSSTNNHHSRQKERRNS